ncbi:hypothetical protein DSM106972_018920 [Dulcicalothrix desertica PCC 7102]|uniref:Uncharacterized protein n=1 Tax=Dulcicalothrix desertica PCC 7102 TaxID=232991 RepID=A0A433VNM1_9CYAN|nr:hypothetical protein [Dulcicalothrix desertica]RUT07632.1 hypothetical protein DSM106972_018920 [Dulcicalothrix desertica PCC 7102]TWH39801.1 hypothetical protein CAL7102_09062 [Dulcicalothrix desertica PCC 7102]
MKIHNIEQSQFKKIDIARQILFDEDARRFSLIDLGKEFGCYGLSWRSDLIEPIIVISANQQIWIGIDQRLAAINLNTGHILVSLPVLTNILQIQVVNTATLVLTESELLLFNLDGSIRYIKGLPELASKMLICDYEVQIYGVEGDIWVMDTQTGTFKQSLVAA